MNKVFIILVFVLVTLTMGCLKEDSSANDEYQSTGLILGSDKGLCPCCGGWVLKIDGDDTMYRLEALPSDAGFSLSEATMAVSFDWRFNRKCASFTYLSIDKIKKT